MPRESLIGPAIGRRQRQLPPKTLKRWRKGRWRDPSSKTFHIFSDSAQVAICGASRRWGWTDMKCEGHKTCRECRRQRAESQGKPFQQMEKVKLKIDAEDLAAIDALCGRNARNEFIRDAVREKLKRKAVRQ